MKFLSILSFCTLWFCASQAQTVSRIELPSFANTDGYHVVSLGAKGVVLVAQLGRGQYNIQKFNTELTRDWNLNQEIDRDLQLVKSSYDGTSIYLLFSQLRPDYYQIIKVNVALGFLETFYLSSVDRFQITNFEATGYSVFMAGNIRNEPTLIYTNLVAKQSKILPSANQPNAVIQSVELDTAKHLINVCYALRKGREVKLLARTFDELGQSLGQVLVQPEPEYSLLNGRLFIMNDSTKILIGTYGFRNMQSNSSAASQGVFVSKIEFDEVTTTQYHSFTDFKNFFNFMTDRNRERIERKIEKRKDNGEDLRLTYRLLIHNIIPQGNDYLISADVFYPEYRNNNVGPYGMNSALYSPFYTSALSPYRFYPMGFYNPWLFDPFYSYNRNSQTLTGFVYTHAIVASIDQKGALRWDNCLPYNNLKSYDLREKSRLKINDDQTVSMFYSDKGAINGRVFDQDKVIADRPPVKITTDDANDRVRQTDTDDVMHWYDNYYLATGYQRISGSEGRRNVFYMNKVAN